MLQTFLTIWRWVFGISLADMGVGMLLLWLWSDWSPKPVKNWLYKHPWVMAFFWVFCMAILLTLLTDHFHRWGQRHFDAYRVLVLIIAILGAAGVVAGIGFDPLLDLGMVLIFWVVALILWERAAPLDELKNAEESR